MYKIAKKQSVSGWDEDMYKKHALEMWEQNKGSPYIFIECSRVMKISQSMIGKQSHQKRGRRTSMEWMLLWEATWCGWWATKKAKAIDAKAKIKKNQSTENSSVALDDELMQNIAVNFKKHTEVAINRDCCQMLMIQLHYYERQGNQQEADWVFKEILDITVAQPVLRPIAMDIMDVPPVIDLDPIDLQDTELVSANESSSSDSISVGISISYSTRYVWKFHVEITWFMRKIHVYTFNEKWHKQEWIPAY
jgi:hypothetical protein